MERVLALFPVLRERRDQVVGTLSGGEQQMCAIGRALMSGPSLMLIDELSLGLAPIVVEQLLEALTAVRAERDHPPGGRAGRPYRTDIRRPRLRDTTRPRRRQRAQHGVARRSRLPKAVSRRMSGPLDSYFSPRSVAVVGASNVEGKMGHRFMGHLERFEGRVYPVHPSEPEVRGRRAYRTLADLPEPVDLLIALVPARRLLEVLRECPARQARFLLAIPSGFAETDGGAALQSELTRAISSLGMRLVGPNSVGMVNTSHQLNASMVPDPPVAGPGLSCLTQSGGFAMAAWMYSHNHGLAINTMCDLGNAADLGAAEVLEHFQNDPASEVVGVFLESAQDREALTAALARLAVVKPVVVARTGATPSGSRASTAHVGASFDGHDPLPASVVVADTGLEVLHAAKALAWQPRPRGRRVAVLTGSGGIGAEIADLCHMAGLEVPAFSPGLRAALATELPAFATVGNPVDVTPIWWQYARLFPGLIAALQDSGEIDLILVTVIDVASELPALAEALAAAERQRLTVAHPVPVYVYFGAPDRALANRRTLEEARIPCYVTTQEIVRVAASALPMSREDGVTPPSRADRLYRRARRIAATATRPLRRARVIIIFRKDLLEDLVPYRARIPIDVRIAEGDELLARLAAFKESDEDIAGLYARRHRRGQRCFVAWVDGEPVGFNWLAFGEEVDEDRTVLLAEHEVYCLDAFTLPRWRGNAIHTELLSRMLEHAKAAGHTTAYTQVNSVRTSSRVTHERLDWTVSGRLLHVRMPAGRRAFMRLLSGSSRPIVHMQK